MSRTRARFGRERRIRKSDEFAFILKTGLRGAAALASVAATPAKGRGRLGVSASVKVGGSVRRNRARRMVREYYRQTYKGSATHDIVVTLKAGFAELSSTAVGTTLFDAISKAVGGRKRPGRPPRSPS
jgi:ribonuclease P protein component